MHVPVLCTLQMLLLLIMSYMDIAMKQKCIMFKRNAVLYSI